MDELEKELDGFLSEDDGLEKIDWQNVAGQFEKPLAESYRETISRQRLDELIRLFAKSYAAHLKSMRMAEALLASTRMKNVKKIRSGFTKAASKTLDTYTTVLSEMNAHIEALPAKVRSETAKKGGDSRNEENRKLRDAIRASWKAGNFSSRDICAQEEWQALGFGSQKAARNALLNTPDPSPWPAKKQSTK
jgi:hypothetical protein